MTAVQISLLGGFSVSVDGKPVPAIAWKRRSASSLVKLLALSPARSLHRDQLSDALWPDLPSDVAQPRLHSAAHYARRALGDRAAVVLRGELVSLLPEAETLVDVDAFVALAAAVKERPTATAVDEALAIYAGPLLPEDVFEPWSEADRERLRQLHLDVLRAGERWEQMLAGEPADEQAHLELMRAYAERGDRRSALRQYERLDRALRSELGVGPSRDAVALRDRLLAEGGRSGRAVDVVRLIGRRPFLQQLEGAVAQARNGRGSTVLVSGAAGAGTSAVLRWTTAKAGAAGVRVGAGAATAAEGAWPYAPVLEALADLARQHATLLDGLDDAYREEIERALRGGELQWSGEGGHQRLFVSVAELVRLAAAGAGAVLTIDDLHEADEATLRLLHYLARTIANERVVLVLGHRATAGSARLDRMRDSLLRRRAAVELRLPPLTPAGTAALLADRHGGPVDDEVAHRVHLASGGLPLRIIELSGMASGGGPSPVSVRALLHGCVEGTEDVLRRLAVAGATFGTDELVAIAGVDEETAFTLLDGALDSGLLDTVDRGYRFRSSLVRDALLADIPPHRLQRLHRDVAAALLSSGAAPARIGHHLMQAGEASAAAPHLLRAAETAAALGAYRDALDLVEQIGETAGEQRERLLALRADLLLAVGDPGVVAAYRRAVDVATGESRRVLLARLARAASLAGDRDTAAEALTGLEPDGGPADSAILLARGSIAYFNGDLDAARAAADQARARLDGAADWRLLDLITLQGLIAHDRGEWFERLRHELQRTVESPALATAVFDAHLCVAEYLLYGPTPYDEVRLLGTQLRESAQRAGALRAVAFAYALTGEAALLSGDLDAAERDLLEAVDLHSEVVAAGGEAHSLQRLAEVRLLQGDRVEARRLLQRALPLARWSPISSHLMQRIAGTMITAADTPEEAHAAAERAEATVGQQDSCSFCQVMLSVPAAIAFADAGDLPAAQRHLDLADRSATLWSGTAWQAAVLEARAHLTHAEGDATTAAAILHRAAELFASLGHPLDALRCRRPIQHIVVLPDQRASVDASAPVA